MFLNEYPEMTIVEFIDNLSNYSLGTSSLFNLFILQLIIKNGCL